MKSVMRHIDKFCLKHPGFGIPKLMTVIVAGNAVVWLLSMMDTTGLIPGILYFSASGIMRGEVWRLLTFVFVPSAGGIWLLVSLYFYYFIGSALNGLWGTAKFTIYYLSGILFSVIYGFVIRATTGRDVNISAAYINLSMFFSFATFYPETRVMLFFIIPIKIKWLALLNAAYFLIAFVTNPFPYNLVPVTAVLNYLLFCGDWLFDFIRPARIKRNVRQTQTTVNFRRAARRVMREESKKPYNRKCEVCGCTDTESPEKEFRYCSRCEGYHCFCEDHINNHIHFRE